MSTTAEQLQEAHDRKVEETLKARAALVGVEVHKLATGGWLVHRWNLYRGLPDGAALVAWLDAKGAPA